MSTLNAKTALKLILGTRTFYFIRTIFAIFNSVAHVFCGNAFCRSIADKFIRTIMNEEILKYNERFNCLTVFRTHFYIY